jgi:hypothetical protein
MITVDYKFYPHPKNYIFIIDNIADFVYMYNIHGLILPKRILLFRFF